MLKNLLYIHCLFLLLTTCKTVDVQQGTPFTTTQNLALGNIGLDRNLLLERRYTSTAIPNYGNPIKLSFVVESFSKSSFKAFTEAHALQSQTIEIHYVDSLKTKPKFVSFKIADRVALIKELNSKENNGVKDYLELNPTAGIITDISMALKAEDLDLVLNSDAIYLVSHGLKTLGLQLNNNNSPTQTIGFNQGIVFGYDISYCCWQEDNRHQLHIVDLVEHSNACPISTYRKANRAKTNDDYFKF